MPRSGLLDRKKVHLEKLLALLMAQYDAVSTQRIATIAAGQGVILDEQLKQLEQEIEAAERKLSQFDLAPPLDPVLPAVDPNRRHLALQENLPYIDFKRAMGDFDDVLERFGTPVGAALFLLQNNSSMRGRLCVEQMRESLRKRPAVQVRQCPIMFSDEASPDARGLMHRLAGHFGEASTPDLDQCAQAVIARICGWLQDNSIVFIEVYECDALPAQDLSWFIDHFWVRLVQQLQTISQKYGNVLFVGVLVANGKIRGKLPAELCCTRKQFSREKILELPLQNFKVSDIEGWLTTFAETLFPGIKPPLAERAQIAMRIFNDSRKGEPAMVCQNLMDRFA